MNRVLMLLAAPVLALAVGACGSDELSKKQLVTKADAACRSAVKTVTKIQNPKSKSDTAPYKKLDDAIAKLQDKLEGYKASDDKVQKDYDKFLAAIAQQKKVAAKAADEGETSAVRKLSAQGQKKSLEGKAAATRIGFKVCGQS